MAAIYTTHICLVVLLVTQWGDSRCEIKSTGFPCEIAVSKKIESNHQVNKTNIASSINQSNGNSIRSQISSSSSLVNTRVENT